ncbi:MAG: ATP-dependent zinc protease [Candidatus Kerfeldbacteria bacterium]|nr:ATP-dependent zinc protease [Candidatus Kerfeldbacteria bacterium]
MTPTILGLEEPVTFTLPSGEQFTCLAKIDTGARTSAIDITIAHRLGLGRVYQQFQQLAPKLTVTKDTLTSLTQQLQRTIVPDLKQRITALADVQIVRSASGITLRPYVHITYQLGGHTIQTLANISDRSLLAYPMLIGKSDLGNFLIDPNQ